MNEVPASTPLVVMNVVLGGMVLAAAVAIVAGAIYEVRTRAKLRRSLPDYWPPVPDEATYAPPRKSQDDGRAVGA
jgi:hypothetical protein